MPSAEREVLLVDEVRKMLRIQDASSLAGSFGRVLMGLGVCLGAGFFLATILTFTFMALFDNPWLGWRGLFWLYLLVLVPLIIWYERKSRADYLGDAALAADSEPSSFGEHRLNQLTLGVGVVSSILTWGPRALVDGFRGFRGLRTPRQHAAFDRASLLVVDLAKSEGGIEIKRLLHPPEDMQIFGMAVDLLDTHGWIGKAGDGKSLWLNSTFREKFRAVSKGV
jgi:MFS family permease